MSCKRVEVSITIEKGYAVLDTVSGDHAVHRFPYSDAAPPKSTKIVSRFDGESNAAELDQFQFEKDALGGLEVFVPPESLEDFEQYQVSDNDDRRGKQFIQLFGSRVALTVEIVNPHTTVDENHLRGSHPRKIAFPLEPSSVALDALLALDAHKREKTEFYGLFFRLGSAES
jgi:hypothetical protein